MRRIVFGVLFVAVTLPLAAQTSLPTFEVASLRPNAVPDAPVRFGVQPGGRLIVVNVPLIALIETAYQLRLVSRIIGAPSWVSTDRFDIDAKAPEGTTSMPVMNAMPLPYPLMLRSLLLERFHLKAHMETRELPTYALTLTHSDGRLGPRLTRAKFDCERPQDRGATETKKAIESSACKVFWGAGQMSADARSMPYLASMIERQIDRKVVDNTHLSGTFDFALTWTPDQFRGATNTPLANGQAMDPNGPALTTALKEQLGLKLESTKGPVEVLVIDSVSQPTPD